MVANYKKIVIFLQYILALLKILFILLEMLKNSEKLQVNHISFDI
jgi:hypothetical protein